jgi:hypothetical protein
VLVIDVRQPLDLLGDSAIIPGARWLAPEGKNVVLTLAIVASSTIGIGANSLADLTAVK